MIESKPNHLINEKSPYLLQHAYNPVNWFPWCDDAFEKAEIENKPVFLSIGYSTCHWCHVMEKESFMDDEVAEIINKNFVPIKVDREERPDIDNVYMRVCQMINGGGGWPLTLVLTPEKKPFFAGTYFPKYSKSGRIGLIDLLNKLIQFWISKREDITNSSEEIINSLKFSAQNQKGNVPSDEILHLAFNQFVDRFDKENGGFGNTQKFPTPHNFYFLLRYYNRYKNPEALTMVEKTIQCMRNGGIYDHIGYGFHRYSTDRYWLVPHFEKMLYDQALMVIAFLETYQITKNEFYKITAEEILAYIRKDLTSPEGAFYSAEDADSEDEEGKFYLWSEEELRGEFFEDYEFLSTVFNLSKAGNFFDPFKNGKTGENIFHVTKSKKDICKELKISEKEYDFKICFLIPKLYELRKKRIHPLKDDKVLTDWNGLTIAAFAKASTVLDNKNYLLAAKNAVDFIKRNLINTEGMLLHRYRGGEAGIIANLEDYAFMVFGLIELYEACYDSTYLSLALNLTDKMIQHFWDEINGGFFFSSDEAEDLIVRMKDVNDGAIPSGNSVALMNLLKLSKLTGIQKYEQYAVDVAKSFHNFLNSNPYWHTYFLFALDFLYAKSKEIVIVGEMDSYESQQLLENLKKKYRPYLTVLWIDSKNEETIHNLCEFTKEFKLEKEKTKVYICEDNSCSLPKTELGEILKNL
jgi:hypothetical protein